ncbi:PREDICTED: peroxisomal fatty acid beta-oxidation multifunctional protein AIM1-like isoform X1 [Ipomoea nil]|uniref:peroxisomal fatty acid beta-oxidation multifunctional protein AIM1-like isoform X1 n=1 Tax=Ipomoea nil TaxID=35883 RepID=UPI000900DC73|nr:PREDICTED: peroxisomal fatty acid beta-oxidation multifunctional protein AIM1-like isoform X1 [Ipomoea nil]
MAVPDDDDAVITISNPPVNALAVPRSGRRFSVSFDINVFEQVHKHGDISVLPDVSVELVVNLIEDGKKPAAAAAIQGGGGLELALVHNVFQGLWDCGRLVGLQKGVEMMLTSKPILSEGKNLGLIDAIVSPAELIKV